MLRRVFTRAAWRGAYLCAVLGPVALLLFATKIEFRNLATAFTVVTGLLAFSLLLVAVMLTGRLRSLLFGFGLEWVLRSHRLIGVLVVLLVLLHVLFVLVGDPRGIHIFNLSKQPAPVWAATTSTVALLLLIRLATRRRRRQPRYEAWRMFHLGLAVIAVVAASLHIWWLHIVADVPVMRASFVVPAVLVALVLFRRWIWRPLRARKRPYVVEGVSPASGSAVTVRVRANGRGRGIPFHAGQFVWIKIGSSPFVFEDHPFTISSTAVDPDRKEFTIKALGDFSGLLAGLRPGRRIYLDGPYGGFTVEGLRRSAGFVFIAGGVGITPILSILRTLADRGDRRPQLLLFGAQSVNELFMRQEIRALRRRLPLLIVEAVGSPPPGWRGETGRIDARLLDRWLPRRTRHFDYFVSGPPGMVVNIGRQLRRRGIPVERIHTEQFEVV